MRGGVSFYFGSTAVGVGSIQLRGHVALCRSGRRILFLTSRFHCLGSGCNLSALLTGCLRGGVYVQTTDYMRGHCLVTGHRRDNRAQYQSPSHLTNYPMSWGCEAFFNIDPNRLIAISLSYDRKNLAISRANAISCLDGIGNSQHAQLGRSSEKATVYFFACFQPYVAAAFSE